MITMVNVTMPANQNHSDVIIPLTFNSLDPLDCNGAQSYEKNDQLTGMSCLRAGKATIQCSEKCKRHHLIDQTGGVIYSRFTLCNNTYIFSVSYNCLLYSKNITHAQIKPQAHISTIISNESTPLQENHSNHFLQDAERTRSG